MLKFQKSGRIGPKQLAPNFKTKVTIIPDFPQKQGFSAHNAIAIILKN